MEKQQVTGNGSMEAKIDLYTLNQQLIDQLPILDSHQLHKGRKLIDAFFAKSEDTYFMLLSNERRYYTVLRIADKTKTREAANEVIDCLNSIGAVKSIELTNDKIAIEIWVNTDVYYLFPYDGGIIEIGE